MFQLKFSVLTTKILLLFIFLIFLCRLIYLDAVLHRFKKLSEICIAFGTVVSEREMKTEKYLRYLKTNRYNNSQEELEAAIRLASLYSNYSFLHFSRSRYDLVSEHMYNYNTLL